MFVEDGETMAVYTQLYLHCIWATWNWIPLIEPQYEPQLHAVLADKCKEFDCIPLAIGGTSDHIHMLVTFTATITIARLIGEMKGASSHTMTHFIAPDNFFKWQGSYGAITVGKRSIPHIQAYILNQKRHHANETTIRPLEQLTSTE